MHKIMGNIIITFSSHSKQHKERIQPSDLTSKKLTEWTSEWKADTVLKIDLWKKKHFIGERLKLLKGNIVAAVSHQVKFLCSLKCPGEGDGAVALNQVGVRLFPVAAVPLLHYIVIPLIVTLWKDTLTSCVHNSE